MKSLQYLLVCAPSGVFRPKARRNGETLLQQIEEERNESIMENNNVIEAVKGLHEVIRRQQGIMSPDSNGKGHGKLLRTISENEGISGVELALKMDIAPPVVSEKLSGLERDGLIYRERDRKDRRRTHIYLTPDGAMALTRRKFGQECFQKRVKECLSEDERALFCEMCDRIVSGIKSMEKDLPDDEAVISFYRKQKEKRSRNDGYGRVSSGEK